jgi:hypothetical protein
MFYYEIKRMSSPKGHYFRDAEGMAGIYLDYEDSHSGLSFSLSFGMDRRNLLSR